MGIERLLQVLARRWRLVVAVFLLTIAATSVYTILQPREYEATSQVFVTIAANSAAQSLNSDSQFVLGKVASYTQLANAPIVIDKVKKTLGVSLSVSELSAMVTPSNQTGTSIIVIQVDSRDPRFSASLANAVGAQLQPTITELEASGSDSTPVRATMISSATVPHSPVSPRSALNLALGAIGGLLLGLAVAYARDFFDSGIRSEKELAEASGFPTLGVIGVDPLASSRHLLALDPSTLVTEAFRSLRARLRFIEVDNPPRSIVVTSAAPSEGKTTLVCSLAITLAQSNASVCVVDADLRRPRVAEFFGLEGSVGLTDVLAGDYDLDRALLTWGEDVLTVLVAGTVPPDPGELLGSQQMHSVIEELAERFDYVIYDAPPLGPVADAAILAERIDGAIVLTRYGRTSKTKLSRALQTLMSSNATILGGVLNASPLSRSAQRYGTYAKV